MVNSMQAKLAIAFLGSTLVSVMIWDRGSRNGEPELAPHFHDDEETYELTEEERVFHRSKRAVIEKNLYELYQTFDEMDSCCNLPNVIPEEALDFCAPLKYKNRPKVVQQVIGNGNGGYGNGVGWGNGGWFGRVRSYYMQSGTPGKVVAAADNKRTTAAGKKRGRRQTNAPEKIALPSVCYMDCVFSYLNLLNDTALDVAKAESTMVSSGLNSNWKDVVQNSVYSCEERSACANPSELKYNRKYCSIKPIMMMSCVRHNMLDKCPAAYRSREFRCNQAYTTLKKVNVFSKFNLG